MTIRIIREYHSIVLYRDVAVGEELEVTQERGEKLIGAGFAKEVAQKAAEKPQEAAQAEGEQKPARRRTARNKANTAE